MASSSSIWSAPSRVRYRSAILALTALAAGCTIYYIHEQIWSLSEAPKASLQRSNARRQRHRPRQRLNPDISGPRPHGLIERSRYVPDVGWGTNPVSLDFLADATINEERFADHIFLSSSGGIINPLRRRMPSEQTIRADAATDEEASTIRRELEEAFLCFYFWNCIPPSPITDEQRDIIVSELGEDGGFSAQTVINALQWHQEGTLTEHIEVWERIFEIRSQGRSDAGPSIQQESVSRDLTSTMQSLEGQETLADAESVHSWREESGPKDSQDDSNEGQNLGNLLWRIAEEQARKESYVHRGVTCNSCNAMPIKGIRYRCSNCVDFDLCEQCEALQAHPKTHLFYKIRIPAPFLGNSRQPQPVWYPGRPTTVTYSIPKELMEKIKKDTEYQAVEIEALWEQFRCLAATEWDDDPSEYNLAIDKRTFDKCLIPNTTRPPVPNLIYDRAFSFYDVDNDGLIGFREFINGRAALTRQNPDERCKRIFKSYDIDNDGFVARRDFLRMFRAYFELTKELTLDIINGTEDDVSESGARDIVLGSQPISSAFSGAIPPGERLRTDEGKRRDEHGDYQIYDDIGGAVDDRDHVVANPDEVLADYTEAARFGRVQRKGIIGPWIADSIKNEEWPPGTITCADLQKVFPHLSELKDVTGVQDQEAVRRAAHERIAREYQERQFVRRIALRNRRQRQSFYVDSEDGEKEEPPPESGNGSTAASLRKNDKSRKDDLGRILRSSKAGEFRTRLLGSIKDMDWPLESPEKLMRDVFEMISHDWGGREIAEDLSGYGSFQHDAIDFVATLDSLISHIDDVAKVPDSKESADEQRKSLPSSSSRRSRSSSKVRFRDDVGTDDEPEPRSRATSISSRSIPVNERWGGFVPEAEKDVGREVLYQVTQEAFNELLDPVFRLREDLALAAFRTRRMRNRHRAEIIASVKDPRTIKRHLDIYQKRWRIQQQTLQAGYLGTQEAEETFSADDLLTFISRTEAGQLDDRTGEPCSRCTKSGVKSWIWAGGFCSCGKPSAEAVDLTATDAEKPPIICTNCDKGVLAPGKSCGYCGAPSKEVMNENEKLWKILRRSQEEPVIEIVKDEEEPKPTPKQVSESLFSPAALEDLHGSVASFHEANAPALEGKIAQKPLDELLAESGYTAISPTMTSGTVLQTPDPTLPQNRPSYAPTSPTTTLSTLLQPPDPTLPHNRPNINHDYTPNLGFDGVNDIEPSVVLSFQHSVHIEGSTSPPPDPTLPHNRPNSPTTTLSSSTKDTPSLTSASTSIPESTSKGTPNGVGSKHHTGQDQNSTDDDHSPVGPDTLMYYAALDILEAEDKERGGPGRMNFTEWEDIAKGHKGTSLGFLSSWIEMASF